MRRPSPIHFTSLISIIALFGVPACSDDSSVDNPGGSGGSAGDASTQDGETGGTGGIDDASSDQLITPDVSSNCKTGDACGDGGICAGGTCCSAENACGDACCDGAQVCSFQVCVVPGGTCTDSTDCSPNQYCEYALGEPVEAGVVDGGCTGGATQLQGKCLPRPPECSAVDGGVPDGGPLTCLEECKWVPDATTFEAEVKYTWGNMTTAPYDSDVMMSPIVVQLDDDDCDNKITAQDIPEIVFATFSGGAYTGIGTVHAISIVDGNVVEKWSTPGLLNAASELAGGNFDGQPGNEIVGCGPGMVVALKADGTELWRNEDGLGCRVPLIANLDGAGTPEIVVEGGVLDGATGVTKTVLPSQRWTAADLDGDGQLDLVGTATAVHADGVPFANTGMPGTFSAIGDFDLDGKPEVVTVDSPTHMMWMWRYDAGSPDGYAVVRPPVDINGTLDPALCPVGSSGNTRGGGPPTVADFNGDGTPDVALAGGIGYAIFDGVKLMDPAIAGADTFLWVKQTQDCSSAATGSSIFDFNGDGQAEVVYSDEVYFRIYEGTTGNILWETCNTTGTLIEYPLVADVDNDGQADIVVVSNAYALTCNGTKQSGVRVFGAANGTWVRTRRTWNQHDYHVTNVEEDGTIPLNEAPNWTQPGLNNFRQNKQPGSEFSAPDAVVEAAVVCAPFGLAATVRNVGEASLPAGLVVTFYLGAPATGTVLGTATTTKTLFSAQSEVVMLPLAAPPAELVSGTTAAYTEVSVPNSVHECRTDNNTSSITANCNVPK